MTIFSHATRLTVQVHLRADSINETVLCGLVNDLPNGIDFLIGNDIWLRAHPLPDKVTEQAVTTCSTAHKTDKKHSTSHNDQLITAVSSRTSTNSVTNHRKTVKKQCADNLSVSVRHQSKKLSPAHSSTSSVKRSKRSTQRTYHTTQSCANTLPTDDISNSNSHDTCMQRITDIRCENLSAQQHNVITDNSKHFSDEPGKIVRDNEIYLKPGSCHSKQSPRRINTEKSSLAAPTSTTVWLYHIVVCLLHILADLLKEIDRLEQHCS